MFEDFIKTGKVRKCQPDISLAKSLVAMSHKNLTFANSITLTDDNASPVLVIYYEALRELCEAICAKEGLKVYSHEAFTSFLKERLKENILAQKFDRLRILRNGVNYYGNSVGKTEAHGAAKDTKEIIQELKNKHVSDLIV